MAIGCLTRRPDQRNAAPQGGGIHETCSDTCTRRRHRVRAHGHGCGRPAGAEIRDRYELAQAAAEQLDLWADRRHLCGQGRQCLDQPAPAHVEFNQAGDVVKAWGGPKTAQGYDWPQNEHGVFVDYKGNVWLGGNGENDGMVVKFTNDGKFLMSIGKSAKQTNSLDQVRVGRAADMVVDQATNELYVADGYFNHRVVVFDADTGAFKRT